MNLKNVWTELAYIGAQIAGAVACTVALIFAILDTKAFYEPRLNFALSFGAAVGIVVGILFGTLFVDKLRAWNFREDAIKEPTKEEVQPAANQAPS